MSKTGLASHPEESAHQAVIARSAQIGASSREKYDGLIYQRLMRKRDVMRSRLSTPPIPERHVSIAVLEAWADGAVDEAYVREQIAKCHGKRKNCARCLESLEYYRSAKI